MVCPCLNRESGDSPFQKLGVQTHFATLCRQSHAWKLQTPNQEESTTQIATVGPRDDRLYPTIIYHPPFIFAIDAPPAPAFLREDILEANTFARNKASWSNKPNKPAAGSPWDPRCTPPAWFRQGIPTCPCHTQLARHATLCPIDMAGEAFKLFNQANNRGEVATNVSLSCRDHCTEGVS